MKRELGVSLMDALLRLGPGFNEIDALARQIEDPAERRSFLRKLAEASWVT